MPKYLFQGHYNIEGAKGIVREGGSGRRAAIAKMFEGLGGKLECLYFAFGDVDVFGIADLPSNEAATAASFAINQGGAASVKVTVLITPEEADKAARIAVEYRPPGR